MMKGQTKHLTEQVRAALLALPDAVLMQTLAQWLDRIDEHLLDWSDECRSALGYRIQSDETNKLYASFEELGRAEPEGAGGSWMVPDAQTLRTILGNLSLEQLYHSVIALASEALALQASEEAWGFRRCCLHSGSTRHTRYHLYWWTTKSCITSGLVCRHDTIALRPKRTNRKARRLTERRRHDRRRNHG